MAGLCLFWRHAPEALNFFPATVAANRYSERMYLRHFPTTQKLSEQRDIKQMGTAPKQMSRDLDIGGKYNHLNPCDLAACDFETEDLWKYGLLSEGLEGLEWSWFAALSSSLSFLSWLPPPVQNKQGKQKATIPSGNNKNIQEWRTDSAKKYASRRAPAVWILVRHFDSKISLDRSPIQNGVLIFFKRVWNPEPVIHVLWHDSEKLNDILFYTL